MKYLGFATEIDGKLEARIAEFENGPTDVVTRVIIDTMRDRYFRRGYETSFASVSVFDTKSEAMIKAIKDIFEK